MSFEQLIMHYSPRRFRRKSTVRYWTPTLRIVIFVAVRHPATRV